MIFFRALFLCCVIRHEVDSLKCYIEKVIERHLFLDDEHIPLLDCHDPTIEDVSSDSPVPTNNTPSCYTIFGKGKGLFSNVTGKGCTAADECKYLEKNYGNIHNLPMECHECRTDGCNKFFNDASRPKNFGLIIIILGILGVSVLK